MISTRLHGIFDYVAGIVLLFSPWVFEFAGMGVEMWLPVVLGGLLILYSLVTRYEFGLFRLLPMRINLTLDGIGGAFLAISPWLFGFSKSVWLPHLLLGLLLLIVALFSQRLPARP